MLVLTPPAQARVQCGAEPFYKCIAHYSVVFHDEIKAARPAQIDSSIVLVIVVAPAIKHPSINVVAWYRALVRLVKLEFPVAENLGLRLPQRALTFAL